LHLAAKDKSTIERVVALVDSPPVNLGQKNQSEGPKHFLGCVCEQVAHANEQAALAEPGCMCQTCKRKELHMYLRQRSPRFKQEMGFLKYRF
jgi:hypothetical protein